MRAFCARWGAGARLPVWSRAAVVRVAARRGQGALTVALGGGEGGCACVRAQRRVGGQRAARRGHLRRATRALLADRQPLLRARAVAGGGRPSLVRQRLVAVSRLPGAASGRRSEERR